MLVNGFRGFGVLGPGSSGPDVFDLQLLLADFGLDLGEEGVSGEYGPATELAVRQVQKRFKLTQDGVASDAVLAALRANVSPEPVTYSTDEGPEHEEAINISASPGFWLALAVGGAAVAWAIFT
jgi:peptidoglycan hydrolase-like protein with peptidoglycan-binding domain